MIIVIVTPLILRIILVEKKITLMGKEKYVCIPNTSVNVAVLFE